MNVQARYAAGPPNARSRRLLAISVLFAAGIVSESVLWISGLGAELIPRILQVLLMLGLAVALAVRSLRAARRFGAGSLSAPQRPPDGYGFAPPILISAAIVFAIGSPLYLMALTSVGDLTESVTWTLLASAFIAMGSLIALMGAAVRIWVTDDGVLLCPRLSLGLPVSFFSDTASGCPLSVRGRRVWLRTPVQRTPWVVLWTSPNVFRANVRRSGSGRPWIEQSS